MDEKVTSNEQKVTSNKPKVQAPFQITILVLQFPGKFMLTKCTAGHTLPKFNSRKI